MISVRPPPMVLVLGDGHSPSTPLPLPVESRFNVLDERGTDDAVEAARTHQPAVILVEVGHDQAQGLALCRALQAAAATRDIPLIAITGDPDIGQFMMTMRVRVCTAETLTHEINGLIS